MTWQMQEAKNKLSEVVDTSIAEGPQIITRRGKDTAVLISMQEYRRLTTPKKDLKSLLRNSGFGELDIARDRSAPARGSKQFDWE